MLLRELLKSKGQYRAFDKMQSTRSIDDQLVYRITWTCIHLAARTTETDRGLGFICFMLGLRDLFPLTTVRQTLQEFMQENPLTPGCATLASNKTVFKWTYDLHNYANYVRAKRCGKPPALNPTFDSAWEMYGPDKFPNFSWGQLFWTLWHYIAANLPEQLSHPQYVSYTSWVPGLQQSLPCGECRKHAREYLIQNPLNNQQLYRLGLNNYRYSAQMHNEVNKRLGKPMFTEKQIEERRQFLLVPPDANSGMILCPI